jgi:hypothetical protein
MLELGQVCVYNVASVQPLTKEVALEHEPCNRNATICHPDAILTPSDAHVLRN